jgi:hypothetical protein
MTTPGSDWLQLPGATDVSVDPLFCDLPNKDVRLRSDSPLLGGACGTIGAHDVGCDASTEVLVALFAAEASDEGVRIRWRLGGDEQPRAYDGAIERRAGPVAAGRHRAHDGRRRLWTGTALPRQAGATGIARMVRGGAPPTPPIVIDLAFWLRRRPERDRPNPQRRSLSRRARAARRSTHPARPHGPRSDAPLPTSYARHAVDGNARGGRARPGVTARLSSPDGWHSRRILLRNRSSPGARRHAGAHAPRHERAGRSAPRARLDSRGRQE